MEVHTCSHLSLSHTALFTKVIIAARHHELLIAVPMLAEHSYVRSAVTVINVPGGRAVNLGDGHHSARCAVRCYSNAVAAYSSIKHNCWRNLGV